MEVGGVGAFLGRWELLPLLPDLGGASLLLREQTSSGVSAAWRGGQVCCPVEPRLLLEPPSTTGGAGDEPLGRRLWSWTLQLHRRR